MTSLSPEKLEMRLDKMAKYCREMNKLVVDLQTRVGLLEDERDKRQSSMRKPSIEAIQDYIREMGYTVDADKFYDYYETVGWRVGKKKMRSWKNAVNTWHRNNIEYAAEKGDHGGDSAGGGW